MNFISNKELEELGAGLVMVHIRKTGEARTLKCVDIEGLANTLGLNVVYKEFVEDDYDKIGFLADGKTLLTVKHQGKVVPFLFPLGTIVINAALRREDKSGKCRFTIAHELAHYVLHRHNPEAQYKRSFDTERNYSSSELGQRFNIREAQADRLAAILLMPYFIVLNTLNEYNNGKKIRVYGDNVLAPEDRIKINKMAAQIGVSYTALLIRLRAFQMLEYHPLCEYLESEFLMEVKLQENEF